MDSCSLADLRWRTWAYLAAAQVASGMVEDVLIALHEAVANALLHSGASGDVAVRVRAQRARVVVEVTDQGRGIDASVAIPPKPPNLAAEGGRGLFMIWSLMSSVRLCSQQRHPSRDGQGALSPRFLSGAVVCPRGDESPV